MDRPLCATVLAIGAGLLDRTAAGLGACSVARGSGDGSVAAKPPPFGDLQRRWVIQLRFKATCEPLRRLDALREVVANCTFRHVKLEGESSIIGLALSHGAAHTASECQPARVPWSW